MRLAADYVHPFESPSGIRSRCRIRVYLPEQEHDAPVVVCSELPENPGIPVTGAAENIAAEVIKAYWLVDPVWIEYHPEETTAAGIESFELVGEPSWKALDRPSVELLLVELLLGEPLD